MATIIKPPKKSFGGGFIEISDVFIGCVGVFKHLVS
jgi:hypothetical protein